VFVRVPGKTRPATSADIVNLERRRDLSPTIGAQFRVGYSETFDRVDSESVEKLVRQMIDEDAESLLDGVKTKRGSNLYGVLWYPKRTDARRRTFELASRRGATRRTGRSRR
jgi:hypothetical protein